MIRRISGWVAAAFCLATASGCGGNNPGDIFPSHPPAEVALGGDSKVVPVYFEMTNTVTPTDGARVFGVDLAAGANVQLEVATTDSSQLLFELHRIRSDGTIEMIAPVDVPSGFYLTSFEAESDGTYILYFPARPGGDVSVNIYMTCQSGEGRCTLERQPNDSCTPAFPCAEGLVCMLPSGVCSPWLEYGTCGFAPTTCVEQTSPSCGCDGQTYASECIARAVGVNIAHAGACAN